MAAVRGRKISPKTSEVLLKKSGRRESGRPGSSSGKQDVVRVGTDLPLSVRTFLVAQKAALLLPRRSVL